jgi:YVTN family beta-propeller protein
MARLVACASLAIVLFGAIASADPTPAPAPARPAYEKAKELPLPGATGFDLLSVDAASRHLLVAHSTRVEVVDLDGARAAAVVEGLEGAHQAIVLPDGKTGCVTEGKRKKLAVFDAATWKVSKEIDTGDGPDALLFVATTKEVWVMNHRDGTVTCVDPATWTVTATVDVGGALELAVESASRGLVFVNVEDKDQVAVLDAKKHAVVARYALAAAKGPTGIALDDARGVLFCGCDEAIAMLDAASGAVLATLPIGKHCDSVAFDAEKRLAFASCGDGTVGIVRELDPKGFESAGSVATAPGGRTCVLDPKTHALWVASGTRGKDDLRLVELTPVTAVRPAETEAAVHEADVPKAVVDAVHAKYRGAPVSRWKKEQDDGRDVYEAKVEVRSKSKDGSDTVRTLESTWTPDGTFVEQEERIANDALPEAVTRAIAASKWATFSIVRAERMEPAGKESEPQFEVRFEKEKQRTEVTFDSAGKVIEEESDDADGDANAPK